MMKLSISNIAWEADQDEAVYSIMREHGFTGLEIAPTRIFPDKPYDRWGEAAEWSKALYEKYGFSVSSMQSIWYGRQEKIFGSDGERKILLDYTKKAIDFAAAIGCENLVFGCPRNRSIPAKWSEADADETALPFFRELGDYAAAKGTVLAMEANPPIYNTNYINDTASALALIKRVGSGGFLLNLDVGTMIANGEDVSVLDGNIGYINHVHISEPGLVPIEKRKLHVELMQRLNAMGYDRFVSIEMGKNSEENISNPMTYLESVAQKYI